MGYCCQDRCPNTPNAWQLGWISVQNLNGDSLAPGETKVVSLPTQTMIPGSSGLRVDPTWAAPVAEPVFLGFRTPQRIDVGLAKAVPPLTGMVHVYTSRVARSDDPQLSYWVASLTLNKSE